MLLICKYLSSSFSSLYFLASAFLLLLKPFHIEILNIFANKLSFTLECALPTPSDLSVWYPHCHVSCIDSFYMLYMVWLDVLPHCNGYFLVISRQMIKLQILLQKLQIKFISPTDFRAFRLVFHFIDILRMIDNFPITLKSLLQLYLWEIAHPNPQIFSFLFLLIPNLKNPNKSCIPFI